MTLKHLAGRAIALAWPDTTARGDETWMLLLKKSGFVKNLNFKVGHAAIILVDDSSGDLFYFDFGRYVTARGMGRTRSALSDPKLVLHTKAMVNTNGSISNIHDIVTELDSLKHYTHGKGRIFFSVSDTLDFNKALDFANKMVIKGSMPYGALAYKNNSCSRFVAQVLVAGLQQNHPAVRKIILPESLMPSPISNVVNAQHHGKIYCFHQAKLEELNMSRIQSLKFLIKQLTDNIQKSPSRELPNDNVAGSINEPIRPINLPHDAQWLGGIGEGAWFRLQDNKHSLTATRYMENGTVDFSFECQNNEQLKSNLPYHFVYDSHHLFVTIRQNENKIRLLNSTLV